MTTTSSNETSVTVGDIQVQMSTGGSGAPLLFLHGGEGLAGWEPWNTPIGQQHTVYAPTYPGFFGTLRPSWVSTVNDVAHFTLELAQSLGLTQYVLMGHSLGGWIAAEIAAMAQSDLKGLVLVDAAGIKPEEGEITEMFMVSAETRKQKVFFDTSQVPNYEWHNRELTPEEQAVAHANMEMTYRLAWKPYLHNPSLPFYLRKLRIPTLVVWGREDAIIPLECGELYQKAIPNSTLKVIDRSGHQPHIEKPQEFDSAVAAFLTGLS